MKRLGIRLLNLAVLAVAILTVIPLLWPLVPRATIFAPMAPHVAVLAGVLTVVALIARRRKLAVLSLAVVLWNAQLVWPDVSPFGAAHPAGAGKPVLKVVSFNIRFSNLNFDAMADYLLASDADVIGLVEASPWSKKGLARLNAAYPYRVDCIAQGSECQDMLLSKYPLKNPYAGPIGGRYPTIAMADLELPDGTTLTVAAAHVMTPFTRRRAPLGAVDPGPPPRFPDAPDLEQSDQAANLAAFLRPQKPDFLLVGDFNSTPWSPLQRAFRAASGLDNRGHYRPSWPTWLWPVFRLPIDTVFTRGRPAVLEMRTGPDIGSDHLPVEAEIVIRP